MKKWVCVTLAVLCVLLAGCSAEAQKDTPTTTTSSLSTTTTTSSLLISEEKAMEIAATHFGIQPGTVDSKTGYVMSYRVLQAATVDSPIYKIALQWLVVVDGQPSHQSRLDTVTIDAVSGKVLTEPT